VAEDHTTELDAMVAELSAAGMLEEFVDEMGRPSLRLTPQGAAMGRRLAMTGDMDEAQSGPRRAASEPAVDPAAPDACQGQGPSHEGPTALHENGEQQRRA
jgi:hypothetical protein